MFISQRFDSNMCRKSLHPMCSSVAGTVSSSPSFSMLSLITIDRDILFSI